jgi:hypothetical protein
MKRIMLVALFLILIGGCSGSVGSRVEDLERKNADLTNRVKNLENELLTVQKQFIAQQQAMQVIRQRQRDMEGYFDRMQVSQSR